MEMESSRRSAPRPPAPGPKKARLAEDDRASNGLAPRPPPAAGGGGGRPTDPRIRAVEREREREGDREDPERGGGAYRPQQQHIQELVAQYKTGLAELTFNSKPIITNLTIIAGENLHAAKEFAATICANILEVPSDQKLPSLYLLDSIVKNIGRDYIKFFAARLPEVFCKAYKQVDSSVHPGMRHLFGTWKGVFPLGPLQIIGKELGFPPIGSASSGSTAPKPDSQMRPSHSIHINPKYLEARQRLQQSTRAKEGRNDNVDSTLSSETSDEGSERLVTIGSSKQWTDLPSIQRSQREQPSDPVLERKGYRDLQFSTNIPQQSDLGVRRVGEKIKERDGPGKSLYAASYASSELSVNKRDGFDVNHAYGNYRESGPTQANHQVSQLHRTNAINSSQPMSKNWKNSEEEEFLWDDMNSRSTDYGVTSSSMNGGWNTDDADMPASFGRGKHFSVEDERHDVRWNKLDGHSRAKISRREDKVPFSEEIDGRLPQPRQQDIISRNSDATADSLSVQRPESARLASSRWPSHEPLSSVASLNRANFTSSGRSEGQFISSSGGLSASVSNALPVTGLLSHSIPSTLGPLTSFASKSRGMFGQQIQQPFQPPSPSSLLPPSSAVLPHPKSHSSTDHDHLQSYSLPPLSQKPMQPSIQLNQPPHASVNQDSIPTFALKQSQQSRSLLNSKPSQNLENSSASSTLINQHPLPFLQQPQPDLLLRQTKSESEPSTHTQKPPLLLPSVGSHQTGGFSGISHLNNVSPDVSGHSAIMKSGVSLKNPALNDIQPPLPSGPPPTHFLTSSGPLVTSSSVTLSTSRSSAPSITPLPIASVLPPLPPGPPPPLSISGTTSQISSTSGVIPNPLSSLLSSLVAKGLITPSTESAPTEAETSARPSNLTSGFASSTEVHIPSTSAAMTISSSPSVKELSLPDSSALVSDPLTNGTSTGMKDLIGIDFRPEIIREFHPSVINSLNDDLRYQCKSCGLRFELQQRLQSHLDWHASKSSKESTFGKVSRKWFADALSWFVRSVGTPYGPLYSGLNKVATPSGEECEPSVPADESQCICALCGEPFEDLYSLERDEWMYKGTVYLELPDREDEIGSANESEDPVPIVHAKCMSKISGNMEEDEMRMK